MAPTENTPTEATQAEPQTAPETSEATAPAASEAEAPKPKKKTKKAKEEDPRGKLITSFGVKMWIKS